MYKISKATQDQRGRLREVRSQNPCLSILMLFLDNEKRLSPTFLCAFSSSYAANQEMFSTF